MSEELNKYAYRVPLISDLIDYWGEQKMQKTLEKIHGRNLWNQQQQMNEWRKTTGRLPINYNWTTMESQAKNPRSIDFNNPNDPMLQELTARAKERSMRNEAYKLRQATPTDRSDFKHDGPDIWLYEPTDGYLHRTYLDSTVYPKTTGNQTKKASMSYINLETVYTSMLKRAAMTAAPGMAQGAMPPQAAMPGALPPPVEGKDKVDQDIIKSFNNMVNTIKTRSEADAPAQPEAASEMQPAAQAGAPAQAPVTAKPMPAITPMSAVKAPKLPGSSLWDKALGHSKIRM